MNPPCMPVLMARFTLAFDQSESVYMWWNDLKIQGAALSASMLLLIRSGACCAFHFYLGSIPVCSIKAFSNSNFMS